MKGTSSSRNGQKNGRSRSWVSTRQAFDTLRLHGRHRRSGDTTLIFFLLLVRTSVRADEPGVVITTTGTSSLHPVITVASIVAVVSMVVLCVALFVAWRQGRKRYEGSAAVSKTGSSPNKGSHRSNTSPRGHHSTRSQRMLSGHDTDDEGDDGSVQDDGERGTVFPRFQADHDSNYTESVVDSKLYRVEGSVASSGGESYSYSLDGYAPSVTNSSVAYGY